MPSLSLPSLSQQLNSGVLREDIELELTKNLDKLARAAEAAFNSSSRRHEPLCLPDTRTDILKELRAWGDGCHDQFIFWLNGMAGTGKSTIARTIANEFHNNDRLGASFFFSRGQGDLGRAAKFFTTLAFQLTKTLPEVKRYICEAIEKHPDISQQALSDQWKHLIFQPLQSLDGLQVQCRSLLLVIDALDECDNLNDIKIILKLFAQVKVIKGVQLRIMVTSRPETPILTGFRAVDQSVHQDFVLHDVSLSIVRHDISIYIESKLSGIRDDRGLPPNWPGQQRVECLVESACGLFIYAATVCRFIENPYEDSEERLTLIENSSKEESPLENLYSIYFDILSNSIDRNCNDEKRNRQIERFKKCIGPIVVMFDLLSKEALCKLIPLKPGEIGAILPHLRSVLDVPDEGESAIRLLHPSFRDFLLGETSCQGREFWIDEQKLHGDLAESCLQLMSNTLSRDMCKLRVPGALAKQVDQSITAQYLPRHVQYACQYWVSHLKRVDHQQRKEAGLFDKVYTFFKTHFLHWLEALSLMEKIPEVIAMISDLQSVVSVSPL